jgi:phosphotriesterase-related protein
MLLSHDVAFDENLRAFGGNGYTYLQETIIPTLLAAGISQDSVDQMTVTNPRRMLGCRSS